MFHSESSRRQGNRVTALCAVGHLFPTFRLFSTPVRLVQACSHRRLANGNHDMRNIKQGAQIEITLSLIDKDIFRRNPPSRVTHARITHIRRIFTSWPDPLAPSRTTPRSHTVSLLHPRPYSSFEPHVLMVDSYRASCCIILPLSLHVKTPRELVTTLPMTDMTI